MRRITSVLVMVMIALVLVSTGGHPTLAIAPTPLRTPTSTPAAPEPDVVVKVIGNYRHPSGIFSIPVLESWDLAPENEGQREPTLFGNYTEAWVTFSSNRAASVITVNVEHSGDAHLTSLRDASNSYFTKTYFDTIWQYYTGGYEEIERHFDRDRLIVNFRTHTEGNDYLARQITRFENGWLVTLRLILPVTAPKLLSQVEQKLTEGLKFYPNIAAVPITWAILRDTTTTTPSYFVKYPPLWKVEPQTSTVSGSLLGQAIMLSVVIEPDKTVRSAQNARDWVLSVQPKAKLLTVKSEARDGVSGFSVSWQAPDKEGKPQSNSTTLLNGSDGLLYSLTLRTALPNADLLAAVTDTRFPELARIRGTFTLLPTGTHLSLPRPKAQPTSVPTSTPAPDPRSFDMQTAQTYRSPDRALEMKLPFGWIPTVGRPFHSYYFRMEPNTAAYVSVQIDTLDALYQLFIEDEYLYDSRIAPDKLSIKTLIDALRAETVDSNTGAYTDVAPLQVASFSGLGFRHIPKAGTKRAYYPTYQLILASMPDGQVLYIRATAFGEYSEKTDAVLSAMIDSLIITTDHIPTPTVTNTPYPLLLTATALQQQFNDLTETARPTITGTRTLTVTSTPTASAMPTETGTPTLSSTPVATNSPTRPPSTTPTQTDTETPTPGIVPSATTTPMLRPT